MIYYGKLLKLLEENNITSYTIKKEKLIGQETLKKLKSGTGIYEEGYDTSNKDEKGKSVKKIKMTPLRKKPDMSSYLMRTF